MTGEIKLRFALGEETPIDLVVVVEDGIATAIRRAGDAPIAAAPRVDLGGDKTGIWIGGTYVGVVKLPMYLEGVQ